MDVVKRYDVDGVHFDDYFYPYKARDGSGRELDFPDDASWSRFGAGGKSSRDDWRRENVNTFIQRVYKSIKAAKPWVKFGVSPFGIWRPKHPPQIQGIDAYASLYADSRKWLANGWVDYFAPQLYWKVDPPIQSFPVLLRWWTEQNSRGRIICPGIDSDYVGRPESQGAWQPQEIVNQIRLTRKQPGANGHIHWSMKSLMRNSAFDAVLEQEVYAQPALMPALPWLSRTRPAKPGLTVSSGDSGSQLEIRWTPGGSDKPWVWLLQTRTSGEWKKEVLPAVRTMRVWSGAPPEVVALSAVIRNGQISSPSVLQARSGTR
jgi:uncharacterized lipoprotein YddW (UPF0748 family)